jgi:hypothetical protein
MNEMVRRDILDILKKALQCVRSKDTLRLSELSDSIVHNSSIFQFEDSVSVAVIIYALSKIIQRSKGRVDARVTALLRRCLDSLSAGNLRGFRKNLKKVLREISRVDSKLRLYIGEVVRQAEIKKGSRLYEHGISLARAARVLGISQWELVSYVGKTSIPDVPFRGIGVRARLDFARSLFR